VLREVEEERFDMGGGGEMDTAGSD